MKRSPAVHVAPGTALRRKREQWGEPGEPPRDSSHSGDSWVGVGVRGREQSRRRGHADEAVSCPAPLPTKAAAPRTGFRQLSRRAAVPLGPMSPANGRLKRVLFCLRSDVKALRAGWREGGKVQREGAGAHPVCSAEGTGRPGGGGSEDPGQVSPRDVRGASAEAQGEAAPATAEGPRREDLLGQLLARRLRI